MKIGSKLKQSGAKFCFCFCLFFLFAFYLALKKSICAEHKPIRVFAINCSFVTHAHWLPSNTPLSTPRIRYEQTCIIIIVFERQRNSQRSVFGKNSLHIVLHKSTNRFSFQHWASFMITLASIYLWFVYTKRLHNGRCVRSNEIKRIVSSATPLFRQLVKLEQLQILYKNTKTNSEYDVVAIGACYQLTTTI